MSRAQPPAISPQSLSLSDAASGVVCRIPELLRRLRDLESEEAELDTKARQLVEEIPETNEALSSSQRPTVSTPISKLRSRATESKVDGGTPSSLDPSIIPFSRLEKTLNKSGRKHRDAGKGISADGVVRISDVAQKQAQGKDIHRGRQHRVWGKKMKLS